MGHSELPSDLLRAAFGAMNGAGVLYLLALLAYAAWMFSDPRARALDFIAGALARLGWVAHTSALILRWLAGGFAHPPWVSLHESIVFYAWALVTAHLFSEIRSGTRWSGFFSMSFALGALVAARATPGGLEPPGLMQQGIWLFAHAPLTGLAYGFFLVAGSYAFHYWIRHGASKDRLLAWTSLVLVLLLSWGAGIWDVLYESVFGGAGADSRSGFGSAAAPGAGRTLAAAIGLHGLVALLGMALGPWSDRIAEPVLAGWLGESEERISRLRKALRWLFLAATLCLLAVLVLTFRAKWKVPGFRWTDHPYRVISFGWSALLGSYFLGLMKWRSRVESRLPAEARLDRWSYQSILLGIPLLTLSLGVGAVWQFFAWGRYWSWDSYELWSLVLWCGAVIYAHLRLQATEESAPRAAFLAVFGCFVVIYSFLGVRILVSGAGSFLTHWAHGG